ncbi:FecR family protein [Arachidicoccus sp.]|uniref:FecR family protein n=1 Tax=Arachidicoccus sp. TaxID=1872624 RepID=UPI003D2355BA
MERLQRIKDLIQNGKDGTITTQELDELLKWIDSDEGVDNAFWFSEQLGVSTNIPLLEQNESMRNYANVLADRILNADKLIDESKSLQGRKNKTYWLKIAVGIAACAIITSFLWIYKSRIDYRNVQQVVKTTTSANILPGGNKAVLTLDNGKTIILDSATNGLLAKQGNTKVVKLASGQIAYKEEGASNQLQGIHYNTMTTPRGGQYAIELPDGTKVWLNAASSITYPTMFAANTREVSITGEAYFEVTKNPNKPFIVSTPRGMKVQVLGTHFNINAYKDENIIKTTLLEGAVRVTCANSLEKLVPGEQAQLTANGGLKLLKDVDVDDVIGWKKGVFDFNNADIASVMRQLSRWYDVDINYKVESMPTDLFSGIINRNNSIQQVLKMLETTLRVHFLIQGKSILVSN